MKLFYLDHHIFAEERHWDAIRSFAAHTDLRLGISSWNILEIAQAKDQEQKLQRARFIQSLNPVYLHGLHILLRREVAGFLREHFFRDQELHFSSYCSSFSQLLSADFNIRAREDYSIVDFVQSAQGQFSEIEQQKEAIVDALRTLQNAPKKALQQLEQEIFYSYISNFVPLEFNGKLITPEIWARILIFCYEQRAELMRASPAMFAEDRLSVKRTQNSQRNPRMQDAADLMHAAVALPYCDYFVTEDGFLATCCEYVCQQFQANHRKVAQVFRSIESLSNNLTSA